MIRVFLAGLMALSLAGCQTMVQTPPANCSEFIPESWKSPVSGAPLPDFATIDAQPDPLEAEVKAWQSFGLRQSGQLEKANGRLSDTIHIFGVCEKRQNAARPRKKILGIF